MLTGDFNLDGGLGSETTFSFSIFTLNFSGDLDFQIDYS